jgi:hypothetical protein
MLVPEGHIQRSPDWKVVYCNVLGIGWGDAEARLNIGFDMDLSKPGSQVREELVVVMPHRALKLLVHSLNAIIANFEAVNGAIPIPSERLQEIDSQIREQTSRNRPPEK